VRARTGRLLPCFVIHLVFNGVQSVIIVFEAVPAPPGRALAPATNYRVCDPHPAFSQLNKMNYGVVVVEAAIAD